MRVEVELPVFWPKGQSTFSSPEKPTLYWYTSVCGIWLEVVEYHYYDSNYPNDPAIEIREVRRIDKPAEAQKDKPRYYAGYSVSYDLRQTLLGETTRMRFVRHVIDQCICFGQTKGYVNVIL